MTDDALRPPSGTVNATEIVAGYWASANARDWAAFAALLADDVVYDLPQTRERIVGRDRFLEFNATYPGTWTARVERAVGSGDHAATWVTMTIDGTSAPATSFFDLDQAGRIGHITDFWPTDYEPPPGREHLVQRY